ncbi:MAG: molybdenum cofactor biosynthesis protein MoaE [Pseudomonadales bacterium]|nr:molybdenum cofactor biosynthesis protein MoaE [Pseudomonadales bacterium]
MSVRLQTADFDLAQEHESMRARHSGRCGAISSFVGVVSERGKEHVTGLFIDHYPSMTQRSIECIVERATESREVLEVVVVHRVGQLRVGDQIVLVLTCAEHRADASAVCERVIDLLKTEAILWKKESGVRGSRWLEPSERDHARARGWVTNPG